MQTTGLNADYTTHKLACNLHCFHCKRNCGFDFIKYTIWAPMREDERCQLLYSATHIAEHFVQVWSHQDPSVSPYGASG